MAAEQHPEFTRHISDREARIAAYERAPTSPPLFSSRRWRSHHTSSFERNDRSARTATLQVMWDVMQNDGFDCLEALDQLEACRESCRDTGVPFGELLAQNMEPAGIPPLLYEIMRFTDPELLEFLLENTPLRTAEVMLRKGCMIRGDNDLFQGLKARLAVLDSVEVLPHDVSVVQEGELHRIKLSIPNFEAFRQRLRTPPQERKRPLPRPVEWICLGRLWSLNIISDDSLALQLSDGEPIDIGTAELTLPNLNQTFAGDPPSLLVPLSQAGPHSIAFSIQPLTLQQCCEHGSLNVELAVRQGRGRESSAEDDAVEDWEQVEHNKEWVLASWSGRDEDADV